MISNLSPVFLDTIPDDLEQGILYISIKFRVAIHSCCCGCQSKVVTPLSPVRWKMTYDGKSVSLAPSIGNWKLPCRSHYWIEKNKIISATEWTDTEVSEGKSFEKAKRSNYYRSLSKTTANKRKGKKKED
jgi:hypothetical protein